MVGIGNDWLLLIDESVFDFWSSCIRIGCCCGDDGIGVGGGTTEFSNDGGAVFVVTVVVVPVNDEVGRADTAAIAAAAACPIVCAVCGVADEADAASAACKRRVLYDKRGWVFNESVVSSLCWRVT
jgi:hypothetical protein